MVFSDNICIFAKTCCDYYFYCNTKASKMLTCGFDFARAYDFDDGYI